MGFSLQWLLLLQSTGSTHTHTRFPGGSDGKESACNARDVRLTPTSGKIALEEEMATHFNILAWEIPWTEEL